MADVELKGNVDINIGPANRALAALANRFRGLSENSRTSTTTLKGVATAFNTAATAATKEASALTKVAEAQAKVNKVNQDAKLVQARATDVRVGTRDKSAESAGRRALIDSRVLTEEVRRRSMIEDAAGRAAVRNQQMQIREARERERIERRITSEAARAAREQQRAKEAQYEGLAAMRYAMYDVASTAGAIGLGMGAAALGPTIIAVQWERAFADVVRTVDFASNDVAAATANMRDGFVDLAQAIPSTWAELTEIGSLAGQLGVLEEYIVSFTEQVAKFSATTDVGVNDAATAFGRINALLPDVNNDFEGVADAIAHVGNNSIATESQIVRIITQISNLGQEANFSYQELIGFAGALASVGVAPELARGVTTRVFAQLNTALDQGGVKLERWGRIAGMSGEEFRTAWSADSMGTFVTFMRGIGEMGGDAQAAIRELGITSVRDVPILQRLGMAASSTGEDFGLLAEQIGFALDSAGAMDREFGVIADTVASKIQILQNSVQALMDAVGSNNLGILSAALDVLNDRLDQLTDFAGSDVGGWILGLGTAVVAAGALLAVLVAVGLTGFAGIAALTTMMYQLSASTETANLSMSRMLALLAATGPAGAKAAAAVRLLSLALKALAAVTVVLALPDIAHWAANVERQIKGLETGPLESLERLKSTLGNMDDFNFSLDDSGFVGFNRTFGQFATQANNLFGDLKTVDEELSKIATTDLGGVQEDLTSLYAAWVKGGGNADSFRAGMVDTFKAMEEIGTKSKLAADGTIQFTNAAGASVGPIQQMSEAEEEAAASHQEFLETFSTARAGFMDWQGLITSMTEEQKKLAQDTADETSDMSDSWQTYYDGVSVNLDEFIANLQKQLEAQAAWEDNLASLAGRVPDAYLAELAKMGPEGAPLIQALADGTKEQVQQIVDAWQQGGADAGMAWAGELELLADVTRQVGRKAGDEAAAAVNQGLRDGTITLEQVIAEYGVIIEGMPTPEVLVDTMPARNEFNSLKEYGDALESWATMFGDAAPARDEFEGAKAYGDGLKAWATLHGLTGPARNDFKDAKAYADALKAWIDVYANTSGAEEQVRRWRDQRRTAYIDIISRHVATQGSPAGVQGVQGGFVPGRAAGGPIFGPGTGTSDDVLIRASNGEHMLTAREVAAMGGHSAVLEFRRQLMAARGYATGGEVTRNRTQLTSGTSFNYSAQRQQQGPIELSPIDRALLRQAGNLVLKLGTRTVAKAVNDHNVRENNRGAY